MKEKTTLSDELRRYGYVFSMKKSFLMAFFGMALMVLLGRFFALSLMPQTMVCLVGLFMMPLFLRNAYRNTYEQRRFSDANIYVEQFLYSFQKTGKILESLQDTMQLFESGSMKNTLTAAIDHILNTYNETDIVRHGLEIIEGEYHYDVLLSMHQFVLESERVGGEYQSSIQLLLDQRRMWAERLYSIQQQKHRKRREIILSILTSLFLCSAIYYMAGRVHLDVAHHPLAQWMTAFIMVLDLLIYYRADAKLTSGYEEVNPKLEKKLLAQYERMKSYGNMGWSDRLGKRIAIRKLTPEMEKAFLRWLMQLSLLLQTENVEVAIFRSYDRAPALIQPALLELCGALKKEPGNLAAYQEFLKEFTLPEVRSAMKMLYSLSTGSGGDAIHQIADMIQRNQKLKNEQDAMNEVDSLAGMYALFLAPQVTGGMKLVVDMILLLVLYVSNNPVIGGM
ncbi:MAG: hypothetical protein K6A05_07350 [Lachnospiraceae bacterium]|nr:hypothetical protein [Lachnospiraceae bacterium]